MKLISQYAVLICSIDVWIDADGFDPAKLEVPVGSTVVWGNVDSVEHCVTGKGWGSGPIAPGTTFRKTFTMLGDFAYTWECPENTTETTETTEMNKRTKSESEGEPSGVIRVRDASSGKSKGKGKAFKAAEVSEAPKEEKKSELPTIVAGAIGGIAMSMVAVVAAVIVIRKVNKSKEASPLLN